MFDNMKMFLETILESKCLKLSFLSCIFRFYYHVLFIFRINRQYFAIFYFLSSLGLLFDQDVCPACPLGVSNILV